MKNEKMPVVGDKYRTRNWNVIQITKINEKEGIIEYKGAISGQVWTYGLKAFMHCDLEKIRQPNE